MTARPRPIRREVPPAIIEAFESFAASTSDPFTGTTMHGPRLLWHPEVHRHYGERCLFFLLQVHEHQIDNAAADIGSLVRGAGVRSQSVHVLYGVFDVLLRVWATPIARDRLILALDESVTVVARYEEFQVEQIRYLWDGEYAAQSAYAIEPHREDVQAVFAATDRSDPVPITPLVRLYEDGLVHLLPRRDPGSLRFYVALTPLPGAGALTRVRGLDVVTRSLIEQGLASSLSVYSGIGFAAHLLSFVAKSFDAIHDYVKRTGALGQLLNMRTLTLLAANSDAVESDSLNPQTEIAPELAALANILGEPYEGLLLRLPLNEQHEIGEVYRKFSQLLGTSFSDLFLAIMKARIDGDLSPLNEKLSISLHFENLLRSFLRDTFAAYLGEDEYESKAREIALSIPKLGPETSNFRFNFLSIGSLAQIANRMAQEGLVPDSDLRAMLGDDFVADLETFAAAIRNPFAHGATFGEAFARAFLDKWRSRAELLCRIGLAHDRLVRWTQRTHETAESELTASEESDAR